ncbi:MAG: hypothetical protein AAF944_03110 [Bacteroidota bacterium]
MRQKARCNLFTWLFPSAFVQLISSFRDFLQCNGGRPTEENTAPRWPGISRYERGDSSSTLRYGWNDGKKEVYR